MADEVQRDIRGTGGYQQNIIIKWPVLRQMFYLQECRGELFRLSATSSCSSDLVSV